MGNGFVDIHCHLLPGVDDGANSLADSLEMASIASADGIEVVVATPHADHTYPARPRDELLQRFGELQQAIDAAGIPLKVLPGADVHIAQDLPVQVRDEQVFTLADTGRYLLLELPHEIFVPFSALIAGLQSIDTSTILSHPERNRGIQTDRNVLWKLAEDGCLFQVTGGSILGEFGERAKEVALEMLDHRLVHFVATDAHSPRARKPVLSAAWRAVRDRIGTDYADRIFKEYPRAVVQGTPIEVPRPQPRVAKSFFARLFAG